MDTLRRRLKFAFSALVAVWLLVLVLVYLLQRSLLYFPTRSSFEDLQQHAARVTLAPWTNAQGLTIGWLRPAPRSPADATVLVVHGNAGHAVHRAGYADALQQAANVNVRILEYPGYGFRAGTPTEPSLRDAADDAVRSMPSDERLFVLGESLGTGVACWLAGTHTNRIAGLLLVAPFDRLANVAQDHFAWLPVRWLLRDRFDSVDHLQRYVGRTFVWVAGQDRVIPARFGRQLYEGYAGPKRLWETPGAGHEDVLGEPRDFWKEVATFWLEGGGNPR